MPVPVILYQQVYVESLFICLFMRLDDCETHESVNLIVKNQQKT